MAELQAKEYKKFEEIKHKDVDGTEFWYARELSLCLEYAQWRNFAKVIDRAMLACQNSGFPINYDILCAFCPIILILLCSYRFSISFNP